MKNKVVNGKIVCALEGCDIDFPLYCSECDSIFCTKCYKEHLLDFIPCPIVVKKSDGHLTTIEGR